MWCPCVEATSSLCFLLLLAFILTQCSSFIFPIIDLVNVLSLNQPASSIDTAQCCLPLLLLPLFFAAATQVSAIGGLFGGLQRAMGNSGSSKGWCVMVTPLISMLKLPV
jgi:Na+(H+)/acetate symporter ActP